MPVKGELTGRRYEKLIDHLESMMRTPLKSQHEGYYGHPVLGRDTLEETGDLKDVRHAAREAGRRPGWKPATRLVGGRLFVIDEREVPEEVRQLAGDAAAEAMDRARREHR